MKNRVYIASDHAGFELKEEILKANRDLLLDLGTKNKERVDYPDFANNLASRVSSDESTIGILICGSGIGMSISANKFKNVRAGLAFNSEIAKLMREHNDANVLVLPGRFMDVHEAKKCVDNFVSGSFDGGRHSRRLKKIINK